VLLHKTARPKRTTHPGKARPPATFAAADRHTRRRNETPPPQRAAADPQTTIAEGKPPATYAAGRRHTHRRRNETPPQRVTADPQTTAAKGTPPTQSTSHASAAPHKQRPRTLARPRARPRDRPRTLRRLHVVQSNAPTHLAEREHRTPTQHGASDESRPPRPIMGNADDRDDRAHPRRARGHKEGHAARNRNIARGTLHRQVFVPSESIQATPSASASPRARPITDARRPGAHATTHAPGPPKTVPHRILGTGPRTRRRPQAPNTNKENPRRSTGAQHGQTQTRPTSTPPTTHAAVQNEPRHAGQRPPTAHAQAHPMPHSRFRQDGGAHTPGRHCF
jgi:hypothetical protein